MAAGSHNEFNRTEGTRGPLFVFANWGECIWGRELVKLSLLGGSKYRTIWLKTAVFPIWPRAKMGDFGPRKRPIFDPPKKGKIRYLGSPYTTQVKVTHQHSVVPRVGSALIDLRKTKENLGVKKLKNKRTYQLYSIL